jgi:hypothetical protein
MLVALSVGAVFLVPALVYLYVLFQRSEPASEPHGDVPQEHTGAAMP